MALEPKLLSLEAIPGALAKAEHYRHLNEPAEAESICLDVLRIQPDHHQALVVLLLALTDQFDHGRSVNEARQILKRLPSDYDRAYYAGIIAERQAKVYLRHHRPGAEANAYRCLIEALEHFAKAEELRAPGNDDALLRWNTCARFLNRHPNLHAPVEERPEPVTSE